MKKMYVTPDIEQILVITNSDIMLQSIEIGDEMVETW